VPVKVIEEGANDSSTEPSPPLVLENDQSAGAK